MGEPKPGGRNSLAPSEARAVQTRLRAHLERKGWSIRQFHQRLAVPYSTVQGWFGDPVRTPETPHLHALAQKGNISLTWLLLGEGPEHRSDCLVEIPIGERLRHRLLCELEAEGQAVDERIRAVVSDGEQLVDEFVEFYKGRVSTWREFNRRAIGSKLEGSHEGQFQTPGSTQASDLASSSPTKNLQSTDCGTNPG
ncbi:helix-turn-helix domain-containing protein [Gemmatimonadota bacterium]